MKDNIPPYKVTDLMVNRVSSISEKIGRIDEHKNINSSPNTKKNNRLKSLYGTMKLESCLLSLQNIRAIYDGNPVSGDEEEIMEAKNLKLAYEMLSKLDPYSISELKRIQGIIETGNANAAGSFRQAEEVVFLGDKNIFVTPPPEQVPSLMNNMLLWMRNQKSTVHPLIMASVFHYIILLIHPFPKYNGEIARLWSIVILYNWKRLFEYIPLEAVLEKNQEEYYDVVSECNKKGSFEAFIEFSLGQIDIALDEAVEKQNNPVMETSEYVKKLLAQMEYEVPYPMMTLMGMVGLKSRVSFRNNYIVPALELGFIRMTIPDKPNSKNQRYVKN